jgi:hypothetical protein
MLHVSPPAPRNPGVRRSCHALVMALAALGCTGTIDAQTTRPGEVGGPTPGGGGRGGGGGTPSPGTMPGTGPSTGPMVGPPPMGCGVAARRLWALTPDQYGRTIEALVPGQHDAGSRIASTVIDNDGFTNNAGNMLMTEPHVTEVLEAAVQLADLALATPAALDPCLAQASPTDVCLRGFVGGFTGRAFRRDLPASEVADWVAFLKAQSQPDVHAGLKQFLLAVLASPQLLFRSELGPPETDGQSPITLTAFEKASALSYFLTDGPPDPELYAAARGGALDGTALQAQARRLLGKPDTSLGLTKLLHEQFQTDAVLNTRKDPMAFKIWTDTLAKDLSAEADNFVRQVLWQEGGKLSTLLSANFSMLNSALTTYYGATDPGAQKDFHKVMFKPGERAGLITQAGLMASQALDNDTSPVRRGLYIRQALLCQPVPDPPPTINPVPPMPDGKHQQRERMAVHSADPTCAACHLQMDPIGLGFESYDGVGRYRTMDVGRALDTSGTLTGVAAEVKFQNAVELLQGLAKAPEVNQCFVRMAFSYGHGRDADVDNTDKCVLGKFAQRFDGSGGDIADLAVAIASDESFFVRR